MNKKTPTRLMRLIWLAALVLFTAVVLYPESYRYTRAGGLALFFVVWFGLIFLCWHRRSVRFSLYRRAIFPPQTRSAAITSQDFVGTTA